MDDWAERSNREAAIMLADANVGSLGFEKYDALVTLLAMAYRRGAQDGLKRGIEILDEHILREGQAS